MPLYQEMGWCNKLYWPPSTGLPALLWAPETDQFALAKLSWCIGLRGMGRLRKSSRDAARQGEGARGGMVQVPGQGEAVWQVFPGTDGKW